MAVIIGNGNYQKYGKDIPNVVPAHADADAFKAWLIKSKGLHEGNIIFLKDNTMTYYARRYYGRDQNVQIVMTRQ